MWTILGILLIQLLQLFKSQISPIEEIILTSLPIPVSFTLPDAMLRLQPWNFAKYSSIELQFHTREPTGILFFVGSSSASTDSIGLEIFHSNLYAFGKLLGKDFRIKLNPVNIMVSNGKFYKVSIQVLSTNQLVLKFDDVENKERIPTPGKLEFDSYTYIGGVDTITRLPWKAYSQTGFTGCINYIRVNGDQFLDTKQHSKQTEIQGTKTGVCETSTARCLPGICGPGKCYERSFNTHDQTKNFYCDCSGTFKTYAYSAVDILRGEPCLVDSPKFQCNTKSYLHYTFDKEKTTHYDDISIDFQTTSLKEPLFLMKSGTGDVLSTFISAEVLAGQVIIIIKLFESNNDNYKSSFLSKNTNLNDGQWHTLKVSRFAYKIEIYVDDPETKLRGKLYRTSREEKFFNRVKEIFLGSTTKAPGADKCTGELKNFYWNEDDLLGRKNRYGYYSSQLVADKPTLPILPPFPRQPPMPCTLKPNHIFTVLNNIPLTSEGIILFIEFKTKFDGIIWHAVNVFSPEVWMTLLVNSNSIILAYSLPPNEGIHTIELTRGGINIQDNTWHRVMINLNKPREILYVHIDDVESLTNEIKLKNSKNTLSEMSFISLSLGGISDNSQYTQFYNVLQNKNPEVSKLFAGPDELKFIGCLGDILVINSTYSGNLIQKPNVKSYPKESLFCGACQENVKKCPKNYCHNKGRCYNIDDTKIACDCKKTQFYGEICDIKRPSCDPNPCKNGVCQIIQNSRICNCTGTGFTGFDCEVSRCSNHKCQNNGICIIKKGIPECDCSKTIYEGQFCETPKCPLDFCQNNGHCLLNSDNQLPFCVCNGTGFYGYRCTKPICPKNYCTNNGNCLVRDNSAICYCDEGFTGEKCEKPICSKDKCINGGKCVVVDRSPFCVCSKDFQGKNCENPKPCPAGYCLYGGRCRMSNGIPLCNCTEINYMGKRCENPKKCPEKYCENGGTCSIVNNNFVCNCSNVSYTGERCTNKIGCPDNYCKNGGACEIHRGKFGCNCSLTAYGGEQCDQKVDGVMCDYKEPGYAITSFKPPMVSSGIVTSMGFQTFVKTGTLFCYETADDKYWLIKLVDGRLVVDINGAVFNMKNVVNDGRYHFLKVTRDEVNFVISLDPYPFENLIIPIAITSILTLPNNVIIYTKLTLCNSCPDTFNRDRFQGVIGKPKAGHIDISKGLKSDGSGGGGGEGGGGEGGGGGGIMIGGIKNIETPISPLPKIPTVQSCYVGFCKNGGKCLVKNYGPKCDCGINGFTGNQCDQKIMVVKSVPPTPGYVVIIRNPVIATNFDLVRFMVESSESSTPLLSLITSEGNSVEFKIENQQMFIRVNGEANGPLSDKLIEKNVPNFFKLVNLLGRVTAYVNGTKLGHIVLKEPIIMKNNSIQVSKVIIGANRNMDETIKGSLGDFRYDDINLVLQNATFHPKAKIIPNIKLEQWRITGRKMPDLKQIRKGTHGGVVFHLTKFTIDEGFGAGDIVSISNGPIVLGAQLMGATTVAVDPFILGIILALFLLIIALIWAFMNLIFSRSHVSADGNKLKLLLDNNALQMSPLLQEKASIQLLSGALPDIHNETMVNTVRQNRMDINKTNEMLTGNSFNKSTFGTTGSADLERIQPVKYASVFAQQEASFQQPNVFSEGEMKIDCCVMSSNSKYAITGSVSGPPQVWDLNDGFLIHIMDGANQACTSLHLAMNNSVLIGLVTQNQQPLHLKLLMMWKFPGGQIIDFVDELICTTCCVSNDSSSVIVANEMKDCSITILNLTNQQTQKLIYKSALISADGIQLLKQTKNGQFLIAGFQTLDNSTGYMVFDMVTQSTKNGTFKIKANINCTDFINNNEAVTGTESGELIIWDLNTVQAVRRILINPELVGISESRNPHTDTIACVAVSSDNSLLASTGLDATVKVWDMEAEKLLYNLQKHRDEIQSLAWSMDNEMLVSGSLDGSIRVWNVTNGQEMCGFNSNIEISKVLLSDDKKVVVGLGERAGVNKLVMLKILRNIHQVPRTDNNEFVSQLL